MSSLPTNRKTIFIFDRDNHKIVEKMSGGEAGYRVLGNNVYSFCIPVPDHRDGYEKISIEHYYTDNDIRVRDPETGRRLWFSNEIVGERNLTTNKHVYRVLPEPRAEDELRKVVFDQPASEIIDQNGDVVGLSKAAFMTTIIENPEISAGFDRSAFRQIFAVIDEITRHAN